MESINKDRARAIWIHAQRLDQLHPFGKDFLATTRAIEHLGYVQIDTINVIERCHHHILFNRIPHYKRSDLHLAQSKSKTVFEYWTHALSYVPTKDFSIFLNHMNKVNSKDLGWFKSVTDDEVKKILKLIKKEGAISIRDITDDELVEKEHEWASKKPSKKVLQRAFYCGKLVIAERIGMLKKYELTERHFDWKKKPKAANDNEVLEYMLNRSLRSQGFVSLDSICHLDPQKKSGIAKLIEKKVKTKELLPLKIDGLEKNSFWITPNDLKSKIETPLTHILSPFDPLIIQRKRLEAIFDYKHRFEAYVPREKRIFGYFALPVLSGDTITALLDLKTDRQQKKLLIQKWTWLPKMKTGIRKKEIEEELHRFEKFQLILK